MKEGGCTNTCICMGTHSQPLLQNRLIDVYELGRDEVLMAHTCVKVFRPDPPRGGSRGAKIGQRGSPSSKETSSSDRKATATNQMDSNDLEACGKKCCYFWFHFKVQILTRSDVFLDLVILAYFNVISIRFMRQSALSAFICIISCF